ncbi:ABC transporter permease [Agrilutibacter solisilvae]|uniref:ABC transporter permease n=1 Tax=Agrilutibacter solisilvae TaxID=2763317 RepID=UPI001FD667DC|nr:ABC transporter permease [Lysobacter solisilvae]
MNAIAHPRSPLAAPHATHKLKLLLRREFWEHKGGFLWAPLIAGGIAILFALVAAVAGTVIGQKHGVHFDQDVPSEAARISGAVGDGALMGGIGLAMAVLAFVVFFYSLGSLYDDRRDRSILFWKSMPVSDAQMVLSKAAWALVLAPLIALGIGLIIGLAFWLIAITTTTVNGLPGGTGILVNSHPFRVIGNILLALPVQIMWSLPAVGWLMLCSAWSRRVPFLWATMLPILTCAMISFMGIFPGVEIPHDKLWYTIVYRGLVSVVPGSWAPTVEMDMSRIQDPSDFGSALDAAHSWQVFGHADVWIGALIGAAMIYGAIRLRRWREEG